MIEFDGVEKAFGPRRVLRGVSFSVARGEIVFILGRSGTGKSVLLKSIVGLTKVDAGRILVEGTDVVALDEPALAPIRRQCGMVFQHPALFDSISVFDNVAYGLRRHHPDWDPARVRERVERCLTHVNLPADLDKRPAEISYGMQKRVSLARTIALEPRTLLFDEPTTGLDPITTNAINRLIRELSRRLETTSVVVSHDMRCAMAIADRILVLDEGQIVADGTPAELRSSTHALTRDFLREAGDAEPS